MEQYGHQVNFCNMKQNFILFLKCLVDLIFALFFEGPKLPKTLKGPSCVTQGNELIVIGGESSTGGNHYSSDLFKLKLENSQYEWTTMNAKLNTPRVWFVASLIPVQFN